MFPSSEAMPWYLNCQNSENNTRRKEETQTEGTEIDKEQWIEEERKIKRNFMGERPSWEANTSSVCTKIPPYNEGQLTSWRGRENLPYRQQNESSRPSAILFIYDLFHIILTSAPRTFN